MNRNKENIVTPTDKKIDKEVDEFFTPEEIKQLKKYFPTKNKTLIKRQMQADIIKKESLKAKKLNKKKTIHERSKKT